MGKQEDFFAAAKKLGYDDVILIGVSDDGDITTIHTTDDLTTISLLEVSASQMQRELLEELLERVKGRTN